ncbi:response regulator [Sinorhizobium alkalisoli]|uniref:Histidine kinase n=1 Tax=Sinorhizobium alkalisoli TaxID=1752398 RepID=A0A1E3VA05_9HYPH|nr:response regulator [Sinorhizobium alkalisoli]ODR90257.1 histidine kinase [Sinorhizobium alkalisoli]
MERKVDEHYPLRGTRILIAEDEILIALDLEAAFCDAGAEIIGPFMTLPEALDAAQSELFSIAILDISLGTATTEAVSDLLTDRGIPFLFYSGQRLTPEMQRKWGDAVLIDKPAAQDDIVSAAIKILAAA